MTSLVLLQSNFDTSVSHATLSYIISFFPFSYAKFLSFLMSRHKPSKKFSQRSRGINSRNNRTLRRRQSKFFFRAV